ncbi:TonB-dependent receptor domain-containing protein [Bacteroidota bacterium]
MKRILIIFIITLSILNSEVFAKKYILHCEVFNEDGKPVVGASAKLANTMLGATVNREGQAFIKNVPVGQYHIILSAVGYETYEEDIIISKDKTHNSHINFNFKMKIAPVKLGDIVVTGTRTEKMYEDVPVKVSVLDAASFESTASVDISQGLCFQPGIRVENNCQNCGFTQVRLNGLEGQYSQILIDSKPVFSTLNGVYGLEQIPTNMIDRIEVVRGGGSALYGGSAIGGVINIITKEPIDNNFNVSLMQSYTDGIAPDFVAQLNTSIVNQEQNMGLTLFGMNRSRRYWDANNDGFSEVANLKMNSFGMRMFHKPNHLSKITVEYHNVFDDRRGGDMFDKAPHHANITEATEHNTQSGGISYDKYLGNSKSKFSLFTSFQQTKRKSFYGAKEIMNSDEIVDAYGFSDNETYVVGFNLTQILEEFAGDHVFILGYELNYDHLLDRAPAYDRTINQFTRDHGIYIQDDWMINELLNFLFGARFDKHNLIENIIISPRANVLYKLTEQLSLRANFSTGYRAPQTFDEDLHITQVGGDAAIHLNSPDLRPEYSTTNGLSLDYSFEIGSIPFAVSGEFFNTHLSDVFYTTVIDGEIDGVIVEERRNSKDGATITGGTFEIQTAVFNLFDLKTGLTFEKAKYDKPVKWSENNIEPGTDPLTDKLLRTPDYYGYFTLNLYPSEELSFNLSGVLTGPMLAPHLAGGEDPDGNLIVYDKLKETEIFMELNLKIAYQISASPDIDIIIGCQNLLNSYQKDFDRGLHRDAGYIYGPSRPITPFVGIKVGM